MTKIIAIWDPKGGSCKSTTTLNVAAASAIVLKKKTLVIDLDRTGSMGKHNDTPYPFDVIQGMPTELPTDYDVIMLDYPAGHNKALPDYIDVVVTPIVPTGNDLAVYTSYKHLLKGRKVIQVAQRALPHNKRDENEAYIVTQIENSGGYAIPEVTSVMRRASNMFTHVFDKAIWRRYKADHMRRHYKLLTKKIFEAIEA